MSLTSIKFFAFFAIVYSILLFLKLFKVDYKSKIPRIILLIAGFTFIVFVDYRFLLCIIPFALTTYLFAIGISKYNKKIFIYCSVLFSVAQLCVFKYFDFFLAQFQNFLGLNQNLLEIIVPLGVSFYTFSAISFLVDLYKKKIDLPNVLDYFLYLSFFPKLTCGPIVKPQKFMDELNTAKITYDNFEVGVQRLVVGLFKKMVIADHLAIFVEDIFSYTNAFSSFSILWAVLTYALLIYFDFSGYSDIAIGLSKILGFNFDNNFNLPYISKNLSEFWKRWHISLSSWLQEYLYIPLGGNRKGKIRTYINLFLTMLIGGLWHGANWTFIIWGAINGLGLCCHKFYVKHIKNKLKVFSKTKIYSGICVILTFIFISFTWIFFRADSICDAFNIIGRLTNYKTGINVIYSWTIFAFAILVIEIIISRIKNKLYDIYYPHLKFNRVVDLTAFLVLLGLTIIMAYVGETQFIYGNF